MSKGDLNVDGYFHKLVQHAHDFVDDLQELYTTDGANASVIDTPNVHRILELVHVTIPTFGHSLLIAELPFESFHQSLKRSLSKNTTKRSHISAMKCVLLSDWFRSIARTMSSIVAKQVVPEQSLTDIAKALIPFGQYLFNDRFQHEDFPTFRDTLFAHIEDELLGPLASFLVDEFPPPPLKQSSYCWNYSSKVISKGMIQIDVTQEVRDFSMRTATDLLSLMNYSEMASGTLLHEVACVQ